MSLRNWLRLWWPSARPRSLAPWRVVMYTRRDCHLCESAWQRLTAAQQRYGFSLEKIDIDGKAATLVAEYGPHVPVVTVNGKVRFRGVVNAALLQRLFDAQE